MNKELGDIEELYKNELADLSVLPDDSLEDGVMNAINFDQPSTKPNRGGFLPYLLILLFLSVGGCVTLLLSGQENVRKLSGIKNETPSKTNSHTQSAMIELNDSKKEETQANSSIINSSNIIVSNDSQTSETNEMGAFSNLENNNGSEISYVVETNIPENAELEAELTHLSINNSEKNNLLANNEIAMSPTTFITNNDISLAPRSNNVTKKTEQHIVNNENAPTITLKEPVNGLSTTDNPADWEIDSISPSTVPQPNLPTFKKHRISLGGFYSIPEDNRFDLSNDATSWIGVRIPAQQFFLSYNYNLTRGLNFSSGFDFEQSSEMWNKTYAYEGLITVDTVIDGETITYTYIGTIKEESSYAYSSKSFGIPFSVGYGFNFLGHLNIRANLGGVFSGTIIKRQTSILDNLPVNLKDTQSTFAFSPKVSAEINYNFSKLGLGILVNYKTTRLGEANLFEQEVSRKNIGLGAQIYYRF